MTATLALLGGIAAVLGILGGIARACWTLGSVEQKQQLLLAAMAQLPELAADIATLTAQHRRTSKAIPKIRRRVRVLEVELLEQRRRPSPRPPKGTPR